MRACHLLALALAVSGCHWALNDPGTDPKSSQFYFPSGIAMDPGGQYAYIANANADLRYGGGTVMVADMRAFECTVAEFALANGLSSTPLPAICGDPAAYDKLAGKAMCRTDPLDPSIIDCDETQFIKQNSTVKIGNFAGSIRLLPDPANPNHSRLFVAVRGDPSITWIDVRYPDGTSGAPPTVDVPGLLQCVTDPSSLNKRKGYDPNSNTTSSPTVCDPDHLVQNYFCQGLPTCVLNNIDQTNKTQLPTEPFGMALDAAHQRLLVSHLATGQVSLIYGAVGNQPGSLLTDTPTLQSTSQPFFPADPSGRHGAFSLAPQHPDDPQTLWYMSSSVNSQLATFRVAQAGLIVPALAFSIGASFANGTDVRDIAFDNDGNRAFVTENNPPSMLVIDTHTTPQNGGGPLNVVTDIVDVCQTPSHLKPFHLDRLGAPGTPVQRKTKVVVVCFLSSQIMVVDPDRVAVDDTVISGLGGPDDIAFNFTDDETTLTLPRHGYVTNFTESTVSVVDLDPQSPTRNRVIARLGFPPDGLNP